MVNLAPAIAAFLGILLVSLCHCTSHVEWKDAKADGVNDMVQGHKSSPRSCDMSMGEWVYDRSYPLYLPSCPYLSSKFSCRKNGRPDLDYEKWRWRPYLCSIPRFNAMDFLGKMRRKRIMLVGDSIMRNQWESLACLVESVIPEDRKVVSYHGPNMAFHALDFEVSIEFSWAPFLVELKVGGRNEGTVLRLDAIEDNAKHWRGVDVLLFDSAHWWTHSGKWRSWDLYEEGGRLFRELNPMAAYEKGLATWAKWVDLNLDPQKTRVIFRSVSPGHNGNNGWQCYKQKEPLAYLGYPPRAPSQLVILQEVLMRMSFPVDLQNISYMSALRHDAHPSIYAGDHSTTIGAIGSDCNHWCLPGVPDTWNEMLYALLISTSDA